MCDHILREQSLDQECDGCFGERDSEDKGDLACKDRLNMPPLAQLPSAFGVLLFANVRDKPSTHPSDLLQLDRVIDKALSESQR